MPFIYNIINNINNLYSHYLPYKPSLFYIIKSISYLLFSYIQCFQLNMYPFFYLIHPGILFLFESIKQLINQFMH